MVSKSATYNRRLNTIFDRPSMRYAWYRESGPKLQAGCELKCNADTEFCGVENKVCPIDCVMCA